MASSKRKDVVKTIKEFVSEVVFFGDSSYLGLSIMFWGNIVYFICTGYKLFIG